ncbi:hypothetical protein [Carboxydothermus pertinax]|uniref:Rubrerythrin n=1 Tax=Carboxydothermus pertinax TaxID=870242 RepID=A0A1L8CXC6_9THEO|nr:hypothetical protein [Carboxydothermus pertinax]GAV23585.1 rubrerythrin [Carboxydothermus pertinax]
MSFYQKEVKLARAELELAAPAEKDAILYYQELYNLARDKKLNEAIGKIHEEEKMHLVAIRERIYEFSLG